MPVSTEQIDPCKVALTVTVDPQKVAAAKEKAFQQLARQIQLPGFRKGKVPPQFARTYVDPARVRERAVEALLEPAYREAVEETNVEPFGQPEVELVEMNDDGPLVFKAFVPLRPVVTLGPYKGLSAERRRLQVSEADVDKQLDTLRNRQAEYPEVKDRAVQMGDVILADVVAKVEGDEGEGEPEATSTVIEVGKNIADFDNGVVGMAAGDTREVDALYPEDFGDEVLRGKRTHFTVTVKEVRSKILPEMDEAFIKKVHPTAQSLDELRTELKSALEKAADEMADDELEANLVRQVVGNSTVHFPDFLLRAEMQEDIQEMQERLKRDNATIEDYLEATGRTQQDLEAQFANQATQRIRNSLVLSEIARTESVAVEEADVEARIAERAVRAKVSAAAVRAYAERNNQMDMFRNQALTEKILGFLKENAAVTERTVTEEELRAEAAANREADTELSLEGEDDETQNDAPIPSVTEQLGVAPRRRKKTDEGEASETATEATEAVD